MANNEYVNRVDFGDETLIDISDTTAEPEDVIEGQTFYTRNGAPAIGTLGDATTTTHGLMSAADKVKLDEMDSKKAPIIIDSKSGNPVVIDDGVSGLKLYDMKVSFNPRQEGTGDPSPTNIRPITGLTGINIHRAGKNLVQFSDHMGPSATFYNGYSGWLTNGYWKIPDMSIKYTYSVYIDNKNASQSSCAKIWFFGADGTTSAGFVEGTQVAAGAEGWSIVSCGNNANRYFAAFGLGLQAGGVATQGMVEIGELRTDYETYFGTIIPISWQSEAGMVYGGELDVSSGELIVTHIMVGDIWGNIPKSTPTTETGLISGYLDFPENVEQCVNQSKYGDSTFCNMCATIIWGNATFTPAHYYINTQNRVWMAFPTDLDSNMPIQVVGKLVTPRVVNIDPVQISLLVGVNTIWTDADTAEIAYPVDTKKYVDATITKIPTASSSTSGTVKIKNTLGIGITDGFLYAVQANSDQVKAGTNEYRLISPARQHMSIFYGLAKLAGVDLAGQTVTLGQYPDSAQRAIKAMFNITEIPAATSVDEGKVLRVVNGQWAAASLPNVSEVSF